MYVKWTGQDDDKIIIQTLQERILGDKATTA